MSNESKITTSVHGRRLGLEKMSSAASGGSYGETEFLAGPEGIREAVSTAETTSANLKAYGVSKLNSSSAASSQVYTLDPPIPGVRKTIVSSTDATAFVKTANSETIVSTKGATMTVAELPVGGAALELTGFTTNQWLMFQSTASGIALTTST